MVRSRDQSDNAGILVNVILVWVAGSVVAAPLVGRLLARQTAALAAVRVSERR